MAAKGLGWVWRVPLGLALLAGAVVGGMALYAWRFAPAPTGVTELTDTGPTIAELESLGHLCTLRVHVADVLEARDETFWGEIRGAWLIKGDALIGVDMRAARIEAVDPAARTASIVLPAPELLNPRVDHTRTRQYDWQVGALRNEADARRVHADAMRHAQRLIESAARRETADLTGPARTQAETLVRTFYRATGWDVTVSWTDAPASRPSKDGLLEQENSKAGEQ